MKETTIRKAALSDLPYLYEICLKTGNSGKDATALYNDPYVLGQYYAAPYLLYPRGVCFVVEYEHRPRGYIIAAPDTLVFNRWLEEDWLPPLRELFPKNFPAELVRSDNEARIIDTINRRHFPSEGAEEPWARDYPAHLHIDLLPAIQGKGWGRGLVNTLLAELARLGVKGVHLGVGAKNEGAVAFYQKTGFSVLAEEEWGFRMGKLCAV